VDGEVKEVGMKDIPKKIKMNKWQERKKEWE
jgi:hypothetical protein